MLVLHGMLGSSRNWQTAGRDLAGHFHVFALDARNHGRSPHAREMYYGVMADDIIAWMDTRHITRAALVGHSMGGKTAMLLACRHPERVERLVVADIAPKDYYWPRHRAEFAAMHELDLDNLSSRHEAESRFAARVPDLGMRKFLATNLTHAERGPWRWSVNLPVLTDALPVMEKNSLQSEDRYAGPAQFFAGGHSPYVQSGDHEVIRRHFPAVRIEVMAGSGHNPHMDQRAAFVRLVLAACRT
jgi:esterase